MQSKLVACLNLHHAAYVGSGERRRCCWPGEPSDKLANSQTSRNTQTQSHTESYSSRKRRSRKLVAHFHREAKINWSHAKIKSARIDFAHLLLLLLLLPLPLPLLQLWLQLQLRLILIWIGSRFFKHLIASKGGFQLACGQQV